MVFIFLSFVNPISLNAFAPLVEQTLHLELNSERLEAEKNMVTIHQKEDKKTEKISPSRSRESEKLRRQAKRHNRQELEKKQKEWDQRIAVIRDDLRKSVQTKLTNNVDYHFDLLAAQKKEAGWESYLRKIRKKVLERWSAQISKAEKGLVKSRARLDFLISRSGKVMQYSISEWEGSTKFRDLSLRAFEEALPFDSFSEGSLDQKSADELFALSLIFYYQ